MLHPIRDRHRQSGPMRSEALSRLASKQALVEWTFYRTGAIIITIILKYLRVHASHAPPPFCYLGSINKDDPSPYYVSCCLQYHGILMQTGYDLTEDLKQRIFTFPFLEKMKGITNNALITCNSCVITCS
jgi:hypothetical protein